MVSPADYSDNTTLPRQEASQGRPGALLATGQQGHGYGCERCLDDPGDASGLNDEPGRRIELLSPDYKAGALPLSYPGQLDLVRCNRQQHARSGRPSPRHWGVPH